nr:reverse transcriptase domain-containing protein [Tanacetum cinerariifolium]
MLSGFFQNQASTLGTLPSNSIPNPKGGMKAITTRSGISYEGPSIPTKPPPKKAVERETKETTDKEQINFQGSTAHIQPPVAPIPEPDVLKTLPKPNIPYHSRLNDNKLHEKATNQMEKHTPNVVEPELRTIDEVAPMADNRTMEELLQALTKRYGEAIIISKINADHFEIKTNLLQLVQANLYHGFERENPHTHINNFKRITSTLKFRDVPNDETFGEARERFKEMLRACPHHGFTELAQIDTFYNGLNDNDQDSLNAAAGENLLSKTTREALQIIENKSKFRYSINKPNVSRMNTNSNENTSKTDDRIDKLADQILTLVDIFAKKVVTPAPVKAVEEYCVTCGGPHAHYNCDATNSNQLSVCVVTCTYNQVALQNRASNYMAPPGFAPVQNSQNRYNQGQRNNFNRGNNFYGNQPFQVPNQGFQNQPFQVLNNQVQQGFPNEFLSYKKSNDQMMRNMQSQINSLKGEFKNEIQNTMKTQQTVLMEQQNAFQNNLQNMLSGFFQNQASTSGTLLSNTIPNPKAVLLKKLPKKFGDLGKFLIPCDFPGMDVRHALTDLSASINLMPLSIWKNLSLPKLTPTWMTLELADRSITRPKGVVEGVFVKVGKFHFLADFVVVDFKADPRVPLILGRSFLRTRHALIDVYGEEITLWVNDEAVTFNLNQTTRYSSTYDDLSVNRIDIIDVAREEYAQEILGFSKNSSGGNPTSTSEPILSDSSPFLTPFEGSDFILEEIEAYLKDESISPEIDHANCVSEGDICLIENF